jgi:hypothetical protein
VNAVEPTADLGPEFGVVAFDMGNRPFDRSQADTLLALLALLVANLPQFAADGAEVLKH